MVLVVSNKICLILFPPPPQGFCNIAITPPPSMAVNFLEFSHSTMLYSEPLSVTTENCAIPLKILRHPHPLGGK